MTEKGIPRHGYKIFSNDDKVIGFVTSGSHSPTLNTGIGLGYVVTGKEMPGTEILIEVRNKKLKARVVSLPIFKATA